jgi:hypothetical protein
MSERTIWEFAKNDDPWDEPHITVVAKPDSVLISVSEEQAVDSYNETFTCSINIPKEKAQELIQFLANHKFEGTKDV